MKLLLLRNVREGANLSMKLYADRIAAALDGRCTVEGFRPWTPPARRWPAPHAPFKALDYLARYAVYPASVRTRRADVYHVVDHAYAHLLLSLPRHRTVVTCHDLTLLRLADGEFGPGGPRHRVASALLRFSVSFLQRAAAVVTVSRATADDVVTRLGVPQRRVRVIPHGVDPLFQPPPDLDSGRRARERLALPDGPVLLHVGNNWFYKNLEGVLEALALLARDRGVHAPMLVKVGERLTPVQRARARALGVLERVRETGVLGGEELRAAYWGADILVFPSLWEGFGWPVLEAMACGTPVVCSDRGGLAEVAGDAAFLVKPEDPAAIAGGIDRVLEDRVLRRELCAHGLERAREFTWQRTAGALHAVYQSVMDGAR